MLKVTNGRGVSAHRCSKHVAILRITRQPVDERSVAADLGIGKAPAHFGEKSVDRVGVEAVLDEIPVQFVEDVVGPECSLQRTLRLTEKGVTQVRRVDDARIEHDGEPHGPSPCELRSRRPLVHVGLVGDLHHPIESRTAFERTALPVGENISEADPAMPTWLFEGHVAGLEELHECRATHAQQVRRFLRRESLMNRRDRDGLPGCHRLDDVTEHLEDLRRQDQTLSIWARQGRRRLIRRSCPEHRNEFVKRLVGRQNRVFQRECGHLSVPPQITIVLQFENFASSANRLVDGARSNTGRCNAFRNDRFTSLAYTVGRLV